MKKGIDAVRDVGVLVDGFRLAGLINAILIFFASDQ